MKDIRQGYSLLYSDASNTHNGVVGDLVMFLEKLAYQMNPSTCTYTGEAYAILQ